MALLSCEAKIWCKYCVSQHTFIDYTAHRLSTPHLKRLRRELLEYSFLATCRACKCNLKGLNNVQSHVEDKDHSTLMASISSNCMLASEKYGCDTCGITFYNELALQAHKLMPPHASSSSIISCLNKFPKLLKVIRQLHGLGISIDSLSQEVCMLCVPCNVSHSELEEFLKHLCEPGHAVCLRSSMCIICNKSFKNSSDTELHLGSTKHRSNIRNVSNRLGSVNALMHLKKGGYACMYCMLWCSSWQCLEQHLMDKNHARIYIERKITHPRLKFLASNATDGDCPCDASVAVKWKEWLRKEVKQEEDSLDNHAWCHACGIVIDSSYLAYQHLEVHRLKKVQGVSNRHPLKLSSVQVGIDMLPSPELFECTVCAFTFKSEFMLMAHEASFEHHYQLEDISLANYQCCANCGVLVDQNDDQSALSVVCERIPQPRGLHQVLDGGVHCSSIGYPVCGQNLSGSNCKEECKEVCASKKEDDHAMLLATTHKHVLDSCTHGSSLATSHTHVIDSCTHRSSLATNSKHAIDSCTHGSSLVATHTHAVDLCTHGSLSATTHKLVVDSCTQMEQNQCTSLELNQIQKGGRDTNDGFFSHSRQLCGSNHPENVNGERSITECSHQGYSEISNPFPCDLHSKTKCTLEAPAGKAKSSQLSPHVSLNVRDKCFSSNGLETETLNKNSGSNPDSASMCLYPSVPIIAAAAMTPMGSLQQSLESVMAVITRTLSAALPTYMLQPKIEKRPREGDLSDEPKVSKKQCSEYLREALQKGLKSVCSEIGSDCENKEDGLTENEDGVCASMIANADGGTMTIFAVAASVLPDSLHCVTEARNNETNRDMHESTQGLHVNMVNVQGFTEIKREKVDSEATPSKMEGSNELLPITEEQGIGIGPSLTDMKVVSEESRDYYDLLGQLATQGRWYSLSDSDDLSD